MRPMAGLSAAVLVLLFAAIPAYGTDYTVGDSQGWTSGVDYTTWLSGKTFAPGDTLVFLYGLLHSVNEVSKSDYDGCSSSNAIQSYNDQNTQIKLTAPGNRYFICGTPGHCSGGMKLAVTVAAAPGGGSTPSTPATPSTPSGGSGSGSTTPSSGSTPSSKTPTSPSNTNGAGAGAGVSALWAGASLVGGLVLMG